MTPPLFLLGITIRLKMIYNTAIIAFSKCHITYKTQRKIIALKAHPSTN